jgi:hypothetical protein
MHGSTFFSGKFKQDLCGGMIWGGKQHFFLGGHFSAFGLSACGVADCGVADCGVADGSAVGDAFLVCQARAGLDKPNVPISAQRINVHRCGRIEISPISV